MLKDQTIHYRQVMRIENIIMPDKGDEFIFGYAGYAAPVLLDGQGTVCGVDTDTRVAQRLQPLQRAVGAAIVKNKQMEICQGLCLDTCDTFLDVMASVTNR